MKQIQKIYDEKYSELLTLRDQEPSKNPSSPSTIVYSNIITYLDHMKEDNILKKVLLDVCFKEVQGGISIEDID